jgi:hypothetical protein
MDRHPLGAAVERDERLPVKASRSISVIQRIFVPVRLVASIQISSSTSAFSVSIIATSVALR